MDQIIKDAYLSMHTVTILAQENASLCRANKKKRQKRTCPHRQIAHEGGLTIAGVRLLARHFCQLARPTKPNSIPGPLEFRT